MLHRGSGRNIAIAQHVFLVAFGCLIRIDLRRAMYVSDIQNTDFFGKQIQICR